MSVKQIEDAAVYYTTTKITTFAGKEKLLQTRVHDEIDRLIPLKNVKLGFRFSRVREGLEEIIYSNRFERTETDPRDSTSIAELPSSNYVAELDSKPMVAELPGDQTHIAELPAEVSFPGRYSGGIADTKSQDATSTKVGSDAPSWDDTSTLAHTMSDVGLRSVRSESVSMGSPVSPMTPTIDKPKGGSVISRSWKAMGLRKLSSKNGLAKTKTG